MMAPISARLTSQESICCCIPTPAPSSHESAGPFVTGATTFGGSTSVSGLNGGLPVSWAVKSRNEYAYDRLGSMWEFSLNSFQLMMPSAEGPEETAADHESRYV